MLLEVTIIYLYIYSPQIDGTVNHHQISRDDYFSIYLGMTIYIYYRYLDLSTFPHWRLRNVRIRPATPVINATRPVRSCSRVTAFRMVKGKGLYGVDMMCKDVYIYIIVNNSCMYIYIYYTHTS